MNEQLQDIFKCGVCQKKARVIGKGNGTLTCCGREMQNITTDRASTFKLNSLKQKSALIQFLKVLKKQVPAEQKFVGDEAAIEELIRKNSDLAQRLAKDVVGEQSKLELSKALMNIIDDLWVSALIDYPQYIKQAMYESKFEACQIFTDAAVLDREAIEVLENILYHTEKECELNNKA